MPNSIKDTVIKTLNDIAKKNNLKVVISESNLKKTFTELNIDSLFLMTVIVEIEEKFNFQIPDDQLQTIKCVNDLIVIFEKNKK